MFKQFRFSFFAAVAVLCCSVAGFAQEAAPEYEGDLNADQVAQFFAETCIKYGSESTSDFERIVNRRYYRLQGVAFKNADDDYGFRRGELWSPTQTPGNVLLARRMGVNADNESCKVIGVLPNPRAFCI